MPAQTLVTPKRSYGWTGSRDAVLEIVLAMTVGVLIAVFETGGLRRLAWAQQLYFRYAIFGLCMVVAARGLETAVSWAIEQSRIPGVFRTLVYVIGVWIGYASGVILMGEQARSAAKKLVFGGDDIVDTLVFLALIIVTIGMILHHNRKRSDRLAASVARLKEHEFAEKELEIAREMQYRLLAPPLIERDGFRVTARTHAAHIVGGDFYDVLRISDDRTAILAADVSGKGIAASLIMASCKAMIPFLAASGSAADVMGELNARLCEQLQRREFVALVLVSFDNRTGHAEIVNAGMPDPLFIGHDTGHDTHPVVCTGERLPLGAMRATKYEPTAITLAPGERLLLFSDGLSEATVEGAQIGYERVEEIAARAKDVDALIEEVRNTPGVQIEDDVTVVELTVLPR
jgi:Stage II sporulation protein E (SpoIIE)